MTPPAKFRTLCSASWRAALARAQGRRGSLLERQPVLRARQEAAFDVSVRQWQLRGRLDHRIIEMMISAVVAMIALLVGPLVDHPGLIGLFVVLAVTGLGWLGVCMVRIRRLWRAIQAVEDLVP